MTAAQPDSTLPTAVADLPIADIAEKFGTPTYVYDEATIVNRIADLRAFDVIRYAQKACSNLAILDLIRRQSVLVDTVSAGEIQRALRAGYQTHGDPPPVVYTADIFDRQALQTVLAHDVHVNVGSPDMIDQLGKLAPGGELTMRINPGFGHGHSQKTNTGGEQSKHGIWFEQIDDCLKRAARHGVTVTGVHMHIGSGTDLEHLAQVCGAMEKAVVQIGASVRSISAGGGLPIAYRADEPQIDLAEYYRLWDDTRTRLASHLGHDLRLEIEPGRFLVAESGYLVAEIRSIKSMGGNLFYLVDAGFNNLARPILYGAYHPMSIVAPDGRELTGDLREVVVGGPLCESGDIFTQEEGGLVSRRMLPEARVGDLLVIECAGAYGFVMSSNYNSKPFAAEVLLRDGTPHLIRVRQTFDDLIAGELIPA